MAQNCRIPGHAGPVRREDFGGCGGAFRMAGAEKSARWSRQEPALCVFMPGAFFGGRFRNPGFSPGIRGVRTQDRALREDAFWGHGEYFCPAVLAIEEEGVFLYSQIMEDFRRMKPGMEKRAVRVKEVFMVQRGMYGTVIS